MARARYQTLQAEARTVRVGNPLEAADLGGKLRPAVFSFYADEDLPPGSIIELVVLPSGKLRVFGHLSACRLLMKTDIAGHEPPEVFIGHEGYEKGLGRHERPDASALGLVRGDGTLGPQWTDFFGVQGAKIIATCPDGLPRDALIEGVLIYVVD